MPTRSDDFGLCLARAVLCRDAQLALAAPTGAVPDRATLLAAAEALDRDGALQAAAEDVAERAGDPGRAAMHARLFGPTLRGRVFAYETEYGAGHVFQQSQALADIAGYYRAFGLTTGAGDAARPDHVGCELEFVGFLSVKEAWGLQSDQPELVEVARAARVRFLKEHLGRFGRAFARSLEQADPDGFHGAAARLCEALLSTLCAEAGVPVGSELLELREEVEDETPMACGSCALREAAAT